MRGGPRAPHLKPSAASARNLILRMGPGCRNSENVAPYATQIGLDEIIAFMKYGAWERRFRAKMHRLLKCGLHEAVLFAICQPAGCAPDLPGLVSDGRRWQIPPSSTAAQGTRSSALQPHSSP